VVEASLKAGRENANVPYNRLDLGHWAQTHQILSGRALSIRFTQWRTVLYYCCCCCYANASEHLNFHTLLARRRHSVAPSLMNVWNAYTICSSLETVEVIRVFLQILRDTPVFTVGSSCKTRPSATPLSAANTSCRDTDTLLNVWLYLGIL
jgi:hypothetical protein